MLYHPTRTPAIDPQILVLVIGFILLCVSILLVSMMSEHRQDRFNIPNWAIAKNEHVRLDTRGTGDGLPSRSDYVRSDNRANSTHPVKAAE